MNWYWLSWISKIFSLSIINSFIFTMIAYHILLGLCQDTLCTVTTEKNDNINLPYRKLLILHCMFPIKSPLCWYWNCFNPNSEGVPASHLSEGGGLIQPPLVNAVLMAQMSWSFLCDLTWVVSDRFHDQKGTITCQAPGWVQDPKIQNFLRILKFR